MLNQICYHYSKENYSRRGEGEREGVGREGAFIRTGRLKEGGVYNIFLILGGAFIGGWRLKEGGCL